MRRHARLIHECGAELIGTFVLVFFGVGAVHAAVLTGAQAGLWQVAIVWAVAISLAIYATSAISGAHINPAITIAFTVFRGFSRRKVLPYIVSQVLGAFLGAVVLHILFCNILSSFEQAHEIVRGSPGSELSAMVYGEYFPNPAVAHSAGWRLGVVTHRQAMLAEAIGTAFLAFFVFAVTETRNQAGPGRHLRPLFIGLTVAIIISIIAPITQAGLNPARDFGPRFFSYLAGWGVIAIPGPRGGFFTVYILAPILGAVAGAGVYHHLLAPGALVSEHNLIKGRVAIGRTITMKTMKKTRLVFVGGFLGAGKTTLLWEAARRLMAQGKRVGLITNDQAPDLVDTHLLYGQGLDVEEVAGSCFCCNFQGLVGAADRLRSKLEADILIAEPVGSCTDLSATILQPLKDRFQQEFTLSPLSVLVDPNRLRDILSGRQTAMHTSTAYIFRKQLEEADIIVINKVDLLSEDDRASLNSQVAQRFPNARICRLSSRTGEGLDAWLEAVLSSDAVGLNIANIDYDIYAEGEAVLGWLNSEVELQAVEDYLPCWRSFCQGLMERMKTVFVDQATPIGHIKTLLTAGNEHIVSNLTRLEDNVELRGDITDTPGRAKLVINARVEMEPETLERVVKDSLVQQAGKGIQIEICDLQCLRPGRPNPTHRYKRVVQ